MCCCHGEQRVPHSKLIMESEAYPVLSPLARHAPVHRRLAVSPEDDAGEINRTLMFSVCTPPLKLRSYQQRLPRSQALSKPQTRLSYKPHYMEPGVARM